MHMLLTAAVLLGPSPTDDPTPPRMITEREAAALELPVEDDTFVFAVFGDRTGGDPEGIEVLRQAVADTNLLEPDLVMTVGDLVQGYNARPAWLLQMTEFKTVMGDLAMPWFPVAGNHDIYWRGAGRTDAEHEGDYETYFGPLWYAFDHKDCRFIVLYTDEGNPETGRRSFGDPDAQRMSEGQFDWLRRTLATAGDKRHVFVFMHHPRWRGGGYGDDWTKVHDALVEAGNVTAVFAGHVHRLQHDGLIDGIEYCSLATVGGHLPTNMPEAGWLDHVLLVTVRDDHATLATIPVGGVMDPRALTGDHMARVEAIRALKVGVGPALTFKDGIAVDAPLSLTIANPTDKPLEVDLQPHADDGRWWFRPDHLHLKVAPDTTLTVPMQVTHPGNLDDVWTVPELSARASFVEKGTRWGVDMPSSDVPVKVQIDAWPRARAALDLRGGGGLTVESSALPLEQGPLTLECWVKPRDVSGRRGLVAKTEQSEYGIFLSDGLPAFMVFLDGAYVEVPADAPLENGRWHHIAGVFDGEELRLYVDGRLSSSAAGSGDRLLNEFPLVVGGDVAPDGSPMSTIDGLVDGVRLSNVARWKGSSFRPQRRPRSDRHTLLLLNMDGRAGPWVPDASDAAAHGRLQGGARISKDDALNRS